MLSSFHPPFFVISPTSTLFSYSVFSALLMVIHSLTQDITQELTQESLWISSNSEHAVNPCNEEGKVIRQIEHVIDTEGWPA